MRPVDRRSDRPPGRRVRRLGLRGPGEHLTVEDLLAGADRAMYRAKAAKAAALSRGRAG